MLNKIKLWKFWIKNLENDKFYDFSIKNDDLWKKKKKDLKKKIKY